MTFGFCTDRARTPSSSSRRARRLLLAGGLAVTPLGDAAVVAQTSALADPGLSDSAAQRLKDADAAVSQLLQASPVAPALAPRLRSLNSAVGPLLDAVPPYLPNYYHSALTAPGFKGTPPQAAVPPSVPCPAASVYDRGGIPQTVPQRETDQDPAGCEGSFQPAGATVPATNAFFAALGTNGRTCATCHQPPSGMSVSVANIQARYQATYGTDAIFAGVDGANCPNNLPPNTGDGSAFRAAHSVALQRGAFRIFLPVPAGAEFTAEVVTDPYGCNIDPSFNQDTVNGVTSQMLSVYRRPRISANLGFVGAFVQPPGAPPNGPAIMWDTREPTLESQARSATLGHAQALNQPSASDIADIVAFENGFFSAQSLDTVAGSLTTSRASGGPEALAAAPVGTGGPPGNVAFTEYAAWAGVAGTVMQQQRAAIERGETLFNTRPFTISNVAGLNDIALAPGVPPNNALPGTCSTCHNQGHSGNNLFGKLGSVDIGIGGSSSSHQGPPPSPELPVFQLVCTDGSTSFNGGTVTTNDPGLALITGKCTDIGQFAVPQLRALSSHAPYFSDGSAGSLTDVVRFYDRRFSIGLTPDELHDLVSFLDAL